MKVKCIRGWDNYLTVGKVYDVVKVSTDSGYPYSWYQIKADTGRSFNFIANRFEVLEEKPVVYPKIEIGKIYHEIGNHTRVIKPEAVLSDGMVACTGEQNAVGKYSFLISEKSFHENYAKTIIYKTMYSIAYRYISKTMKPDARIYTAVWSTDHESKNLLNVRNHPERCQIVQELTIKVEAE